MVMSAKEIEEDEKKLAETLDSANRLLAEQIKGRPYLLVLATLYEVDRSGDKSKVAGRWSWRSNIISKTEGRRKEDVENGKAFMRLLVEQLKDAAERPGIGIKARYEL